MALLGITALGALVLLAAIGFHNAIVAAVIRSVAAPLGYSVRFADLRAGLTGAVATGAAVDDRAGEPVLRAGRIAVRYSLRDLLPGSRRRFGLIALDVERPVLTLIHHADGTYNVTLPGGGSPAAPDTTPLDLRATIRAGTVLLIDRFVAPGHERRVRIADVNADAAIAPHARSFYHARFDVMDGTTAHTVIGSATFAPERGFDAQRWTATDVPVAPLIDFALPTHAFVLAAGELRDLDARIYTFAPAAGTPHTHVGARAQFTGGRLVIAGLDVPLRDIAGPLRAYGDGLTTTGVDATLAGVPLHLVGGVFGTTATQARFGLTGRGSLDALRRVTAAGAHLPLAGDLAFSFRAVGAATAPLIYGTFGAPSIAYGGLRFDRASGAIAVQGTRLDVLDARLGYGPVALAARGAIGLDRAVTTNLLASVRADGDRLPYVPQIVSGLALSAVAHVSGTGARLGTNAIVYGDGRNGRLDALVALDGDGNGVVGPIAIDRTDGASLYARAAIDRRNDTVSAIASARHFVLLPAHAATLPGIRLTALPPIAGTLDAALAGSVDHGELTAASGHAQLEGLRVGPLRGSAVADIGAGPDGEQHAVLRARTNAGSLDARATEDDGTVALDGRVRSSFEQLQPITGDIGARGALDVPVRVLADDTAIAAQIDGARFTGASVRGVPLRDADATAVVHDATADVRAARIGIDGGTIVAQGRVGDDTDLVASSSALPLRTLVGAGLPIDAGTLLAHVHARGSLRAPRADGGLIVAGVRVRGIDLAANATATYDDGTLRITGADGLVAGATVTASGDVTTGRGGGPALDLTAAVRGAQLAALGRIATLPLRYPDGELDADAHITGPAAAPHVDADVRIPDGSINGLSFRDAHVAVRGGPANLAARGGTVTVGTTTVAFSGDLSRTVQRLAVHAPHVDLADFDDYFNTADTLAGRGHVALDAAVSPASVRTSGDVRIDDARVRRFAIGTTTATWTTAGRTIRANGGVQGTHGTATLAAAATLPAQAPLRDVAHRTTLEASGTIAGLDLGAWLPNAGITLPVAGTVDAAFRTSGVPADPVFTLTGAVTNGAAAGYRLSALTLAANGDRHEAHLTALHVAGPGLIADATGTAGYAAHDPVALALHAQSDDLPTLETALGLKLNVGGSASTDVHVSGTRVAPRIEQTLDATGLRFAGYTIPRVRGDLIADATTLELRSFEADLAKGQLSATATVPIALQPPHIGVRDAALHATVRAAAIDLTQFDALLPDDTKLTGTIDGNVVASGTPADPAVDGTLALTGGTFTSNLIRSAFTDASARLTFTRASAQLIGAHAAVGGGSIDGSGRLTFGDVRDLRRTLALDAQLTAQNAGLNIDRYVNGKVNGTLTAVKTAGRRDTVIGGNLVFSQTRIPLTALLTSTTPNPNASAAPLPIAFDLGVNAGNDVRVQGPGVDIGARGSVTVGGTLAKPTLDGSLTSIDGRLSFYRTFTLQSGTVAFSPADGLIPSVDATATTTISNPSTDILLHVTGPATNLNLDLSSNPTYDKEQILGLLLNAQALGAVSGVQTAQNGGSGFNAVNLAGGYLSSEFTQNLLEPLGSQLGSSLGLSNLALGYDFTNGFSAGATRSLGKNITATVHQTFGFDQRTILGFNLALPRETAVQLSLFGAGTQSPRLAIFDTFLGQDVFTPPNYTLQALQPPPGVSGVILTYQRKYP